LNIIVSPTALPSLIDRAASALINARSAAEVLEARDMASVAYNTAKIAARLAKAKNAHDELISAVFRTQADALEIEAGAKRRLADEYDAAQERGEVATVGKRSQPERLQEAPPSAADIGLSRKDIHEARIIRDAELDEPGIVHRVVSEALAAGEEPTRAKVTKAVKAKRTRGPRFEAPQESQHDRDLRALIGVWDSACETARQEFLETVA
jgi:hypothetical protein